MSSEQRRSVRHRVGFRMVFDDGESYNAGHVENISENGLLIQSARPLPAGTIVHLEPIDAAEDELFEVKAKVIHCTKLEPSKDVEDHGQVGIGLEFVDIDDAARGRIGQMIEKLEAAQNERKNDELDPILGVRIRRLPVSNAPEASKAKDADPPSNSAASEKAEPETAEDDGASEAEPKTAEDDGASEAEPKTAEDDGASEAKPETAEDDGASEAEPETAEDDAESEKPPSN